MKPRRAILLAILIAGGTPLRAVAGAWSEKSFANDGALDWIIDFEREPTASFVRRTLQRVLSAGYVENFHAEAAIAAAETVAFALGRPSSDFPSEIARSCRAIQNELRELAPLALRAVARAGGPESELTEGWSANAESLSRWKASVQGLLVRLAASE